MTSPVLVTGGTGRVGRSVVARLVGLGCDVRLLARRERETQPQVTFFTGDLRRDEGIDQAVRGAGVIINCAASTMGNAEMTRNLMTAVTRAAGSPHFVQPSNVGIDAMAAWGYLKAKLEAERIVEASGQPWTIMRVTQTYDYCLGNAEKLAKFPLVVPAPKGFLVQPVDSREIAARLVELALGKPAGRVPDMSGPEVLYVLPGGNARHIGNIIDMWLLLMLGSKERTAQQYAELLASEGFRLTSVIPTSSPVSIIQAAPV